MGDSPYMSTSAFAGNVLLIDLADLHASGWLDAADLEPSADLHERTVNYAAVKPFRMQRLARAAQRFAQSASPAERTEFEAFCDEHASWLVDYARFMALSEHDAGREWCDWDPPLARREPAALRQVDVAHGDRITFWKFCQWRFYSQWQRLRDHAHRRGVKIVGDAPIFIALHSAEVLGAA